MVLAEIAAKFNVAKTTVSFCLNYHEEKYKIKKELAESIRKYAKEHGYVPNQSAVRLRLGFKKKPPIGILVSQGTDMPRLTDPVRQIIATLNFIDRDYIYMGYGKYQLGKSMKTLRGAGVTDVIVLGVIHEPDNFKRNTEDADGRLFLEDWKAIESLLNTGMKMYIPDYSYPLPATYLKKNIIRAGIDRHKELRKILTILKEKGLGPTAINKWLIDDTLIPEWIVDKELILPNKYSQNPLGEGFELTEKVIELKKKWKIRSLFISNDYIAGGLIKGLLCAGIRIPEDIAIISFGNYEVSPFFACPLTTIAPPVTNTALKMVKSICEEAAPFPDNTILECEIQERDSLKITVKGG